MKKSLLTLLLLTSTTAFASSEVFPTTEPKNNMYLGLQLTHGLHSGDSFEEIEPSMLIARFGYSFATNLAVEARLGTGFSDYNVNGVNNELDNLAGIYGVATIPLSKNFDVYALLGFTSAEIANTNNNHTASLSGASVGAGVNYKMTDRISFNAELINYVDEADSAFGGLSAGVTYKF
ncbi:outer membrane beta-barrel protein [Thalassotalea psychrophila]|uniref:Outer membrane beta-barrel protein n=1 Tax=Thalassotalea psychrophila TaxID=3065647 RepID=A0ABY9TQS4_9GAMM|nr:outer membrane beta-barrel protein [Colwelliaceae bacterium SQ149]